MRLRVIPLIAGLASIAALGQIQPSQPAPTSMPAFSYTDPAFGFQMELPASWDYDRTRFRVFKDSIGLLRGRSPDGRRGVQIMVFRSFPMKPFEDWVVDFGKATAELMNSPRVDWEAWRLPPRAGAILTYTTKVSAVMTRSHSLCVPFDMNTVWVFSYTGSVTGDAESAQVRGEFDQITRTLRIHYDPEEAERLAPAFERGQTLLAKLRSQAAQVRLDEDEHYYETHFAGKPVGYLRRRIAREEYVFSGPNAKRRLAKDGLRIRDRSWRFADDGTAWYIRVDLFSSFDFKDELMENQQTQIPPPAAAAPELFVRTDRVLREDDVLYSSYTTSRDTALPDPAQPISAGPVYLDQAWVRLLPGVLLGEPEELHAVAIYNSDTRALVAYTAKLLGERRVPGYGGAAYAFEVREGLMGSPSLLCCDERGTLLRLEAGEVVLTRVSRAEIERKYGPRRDEASQRAKLREE